MRANFPTVPPSVPEVCHVLHAETAKTCCFSRFLEKCASVPIYIYSTVAQFGEQSVAGAFGRSGWARQVRGLVRQRQSFTMRLDCNEYTRT
jgi:hypothetical protein